MISKETVWKNASEVMQAYTPFYQQEAVGKIRDAQVGNIWFLMLLARGVEPQPFTLDYFKSINPYGSPASLSEKIDQAAKEGYLKEYESGKFNLTAKGQAILDAFFDTAHVLLAQAPALPQVDMDRIAALLSSILDATVEAPEPKAKSSLSSSRWTDPGNDAVANLRIDQFLTDLSRYRDDAHLAAWQPTGLQGIEWETLSFIWEDEAHNAAELTEKLERRGYVESDYAAALDSLVERGWLIQTDGHHTLTAQGKKVRDDAETETDRLFYIGWAALDQNELADLNRLLSELKAHLEKSVEPQPAAA